MAPTQTQGDREPEASQRRQQSGECHQAPRSRHAVATPRDSLPMTEREAPKGHRGASTVQLNVRIKQELAERLRQRAEELHSNAGALVARAIEQLLAQDDHARQADHEQRLLSIEERLQAIESQLQPRKGVPSSQ